MRAADRVLEALRDADGGLLSGEELSDQLGVSRAQVWKHVASLRDRGYGIEGEPGGGYRLTSTPDRLYPAEIRAGLTTRWLGRTIEYLQETDSTNRVAAELAREGAAHGTLVVAEAQTAGRGRLGRSFYSPPYQNLYASFVLRPTLSLSGCATLILVAGCAVAEAVAEVLGGAADVELKWPNDVLLGGLKTSGILMEMSAEETRVAHLVLGIGVNLNVERAEFPEAFRATATSLRSYSGARVDRVVFVRTLLSHLEDCLERHARGGFAALRPEFEARFRMAGEPVTVSEMDGRQRCGIARGVAADGALEIEAEDGTFFRVIAGDVTVSGSRYRHADQDPARKTENPTT